MFMSAWEHKEGRTPSLHLYENHDGAGRSIRPKSGAGEGGGTLRRGVGGVGLGASMFMWWMWGG